MKILYLIRCNMKRMFKSKVSIILTFLLPTVVVMVLGFISKGSNANSRDYYIVNNDRGVYGKEFVEELSKDFSIKLYQQDKAVEKLKKKLIPEFYQINEDFSNKLTEGDNVQLVANRREPFQGFSDFEIKARELTEKMIFCAMVEKSSGTHISPADLKSSDAKVVVETSRKTTMWSQMIINMLISFNLFSAIGMCYELFALKSEKTLKRSLTTANRPGTIIGGIFGAQFIMVFTSYVALLFVYVFVFDKTMLSQTPIIILSLAMTTAVALSLSVFISRLLKDEKLIAVIMQIILCATCFVGGSFVPYELLPKGITFFSKFTPQFWAIQSIKDGRFEYSLIVLLFAVLLFTGGTISTRSFAE